VSKEINIASQETLKAGAIQHDDEYPLHCLDLDWSASPVKVWTGSEIFTLVSSVPRSSWFFRSCSYSGVNQRESCAIGPCAHRGYVGSIILVHQAVRIFHVGPHGAASTEETSKGREEMVDVISRASEYGCADALVSWWFALRNEGGCH
jgi:hypothetical protein